MRCRFFMSSDYNDLEVNFSGNFGHYQNDRVDEILAAIPHETDDAKLKDYYTELSKIMLEDCPCVPLMYRPQVFHEVKRVRMDQLSAERRWNQCSSDGLHRWLWRSSTVQSGTD